MRLYSIGSGDPSTKAVHSSKEVDKAIKETRTEVNLTNWLALAIPAKPDGIRMAFLMSLVFELLVSTKRSIKIQILLQRFVSNEALSSCCQRLGLCLSSSF